MSVSHHLTDETIQDYAAGSLSMPMETLVACHLTVCCHCRHRAELADGLGGQLFESFEPAAVTLSASELLADACLMPAHAAPRSASAGTDAQTYTLDDGSARREPPTIKGVPRPLARLLPTSLEELDWRRIAPGVRQHNLSDQHRRHGAFQLLHLDPGVVLSAHSHNDRELTYLVQGSYKDELGRFQRGDIADLDGNHAHQPVVDSKEPCIALIATHSPVRYSSVLGKIMQPFVGI